MKKQINKLLLCMTVSAVLITSLLISILFYSIFCRQVAADLKNYANVLEHVFISDQEAVHSYDPNIDELRITLIDTDGSVLIDSAVSQNKLENHNDRPEIQKAKSHGEAFSIRESNTLGRSTFYYAMLLEDGKILRVAKEASSIWSVLAGAIPGIILLLLLIIFLCYLVANYLTKKLVQPISAMAGHMDTLEPYQVVPELRPFISTIQKQHQDILKSAMLRQEFTANVSHELKTPLTSISGYAELIASGLAQNTEDVQRFAEEIKKNSSRLLALINDIIQLSALDSQEQTIHFELVDLWEVVQNCIQSLQVSAAKHQVTLSCQGIHCSVMGNKEQIEEVVFNLCDNAIRYNREGGTVEITAFQTEEGAKLTVKDTGIGIPKEHQERIFERFYRVDKSRSKSTGGTGLGLAIVKHIVMKHDAEMSLESEEGKGTCIQIRFPKVP